MRKPQKAEQKYEDMISKWEGKDLEKKDSSGGPTYKYQELLKGEGKQRQKIQQNSIQFPIPTRQEFPN